MDRVHVDVLVDELVEQLYRCNKAEIVESEI